MKSVLQKRGLRTIQVLTRHQARPFSTAPDRENVKNVIDPYRGQYTDFLQNVGVYEESNDDTLKAMFYLNQGQRLKGHATAEGTEKYYRLSQYGEGELGQNMDVHHENFKSLTHKPDLKITSLGLGTYVGSPTDQVDFDMYTAVKTCVMSGGVNVIDTAPNYRYMRSERTLGKALTVLEQKYDIDRSQIFVASKAGYVPEDADAMVT